MQTDKAMVINFSSPQTRKPDGEAIIPGTFHIDIPGWARNYEFLPPYLARGYGPQLL